MVNGNQSDWDLHLPKAEFAYNNSVQASTGHTPFFLNYGQHPRMPMTAVAEGGSRVPAVLDLLRELHTGLEQTKLNIGKAQVRQSRVANSRRRPHDFSVGDLVWLSADNLNRPDVRCDKFAARFEGPFAIIEMIGDAAVRLKLPASWTISSSFHVSRLKKYVSGSDSAFTGRGMPPAPPALDAAADLWEVEQCLQKRRAGQQVHVLVKWVGHPRSENTWLRWDRLNTAAQEEADLLPFNEPRRQRARVQETPQPPPPPPQRPPLRTPNQEDQADNDNDNDQAPTRRSTRTRTAPRR